MKALDLLFLSHTWSCSLNVGINSWPCLGTIWDLGDQIEVDCVQDKHLCTITLSPTFWVSLKSVVYKGVEMEKVSPRRSIDKKTWAAFCKVCA